MNFQSGYWGYRMMSEKNPKIIQIYPGATSAIADAFNKLTSLDTITMAIQLSTRQKITYF